MHACFRRFSRRGCYAPDSSLTDAARFPAHYAQYQERTVCVHVATKLPASRSSAPVPATPVPRPRLHYPRPWTRPSLVPSFQLHLCRVCPFPATLVPRHVCRRPSLVPLYLQRPSPQHPSPVTSIPAVSVPNMSVPDTSVPDTSVPNMSVPTAPVPCLRHARPRTHLSLVPSSQAQLPRGMRPSPNTPVPRLIIPFTSTAYTPSLHLYIRSCQTTHPYACLRAPYLCYEAPASPPITEVSSLYSQMFLGLGTRCCLEVQ